MARVLVDARRAARDDGVPHGMLTIGSLETTAALRLTPLLTRFAADFPQVDLVLRTGRGVELDDVDELLSAVRHGLLAPDVGEQAVQSAAAAIDGLARHDYNLDRWLGAAGVTLSWRHA